MVRVLLAVLAWPALILVAVWVFEFVDERYLNPPVEKEFEYDFPKFNHMAVEALEKYGALSAAERERFRTNLQEQFIPVERWLSALEASGFSILCVGEHHIDLTRDYLANELFSRISVDVMLLEATPAEAASLVRRVESGEPKVEMLGARIGNVIRAVRKTNPAVVFAGIEETEAQKEKRLDQEKAGIRDDSIVRNVWRNYVPGKRHVILFGAIHCNNWPNWLYQLARASAPPAVLAKMLNLMIVERQQDSLIDPFLHFLDEIGMEKRDFVIADTSRLDPLVLEWFALMVPQIFSQYQTILIFRDDQKQ